MDWKLLLEGDVLKELGNRIRTMRKNAGMSQQVLSERIGTSRYRISHIENGENFTIEVFIRILRVFNKLDQLDQMLDVPTISPKALYEKAKRKQK